MSTCGPFATFLLPRSLPLPNKADIALQSALICYATRSSTLSSLVAAAAGARRLVRSGNRAQVDTLEFVVDAEFEQIGRLPDTEGRGIDHGDTWERNRHLSAGARNSRYASGCGVCSCRRAAR